ncbi:MAG: hypothetical protein WBA12_06850 [Catalinimonas sp.]
MKGTLRLLLAAGVLAAVMGLLHAVGSSHLHPAAWWLLLIFTVIGVGTQLMIERGATEPADGGTSPRFMIYFLAGSTLRLLAGGVVAYAFISAGTPRLELLILNFFVIYLWLLAFEIIALLGNLRADSTRNPT